MASPERRRLVFLYPEHKPWKTLDLYPRHTTEQQFKNILTRCIGTNSTLFIQIGAGLIFMPPKAFAQARALSPEDREKFLNLTAQTMKHAEKVVLQIPTFNFHNN